MPPLKVAIVARSLAVGGAERHIVKLCQNVLQFNVDVTLFLLCRDERSPLLSALPPNIRVLVSPFARHDRRAIIWLAKQWNLLEIDVVQSFLWVPDAFASLARLLCPRVSLICSERGDRGHDGYTIFRRVYDRCLTFRIADCVIANSHFGKDLLTRLGCEPTKISVVHNGVDLVKIDKVQPIPLREMSGWPRGIGVIGLVSRLVPYKGIDVLISAIAEVRKRLRILCVIVGEGPERRRLEEAAKRLGVADELIFVGQQLPAEAWVKAFDVGLLTTTAATEHCSNSVLEYMACGKPVIASRIAGNPELVVNEYTGLLVAPYDAMALAKAVERLIMSPTVRRRMGENGRARVEREFRIESVAAEFALLWRRFAA